MTKRKIELNNKLYTYVYFWEAKNPKAVLHLVHGSKENIQRYKDMIKYLNKNNITVVGGDLRGHGLAAKEQNQLGNMGEGAFNNVVRDVERVNLIIKDKYKELPIVIYGHSMGSFIVRTHAIKYGSEKYIFSGTTEQSRLLSKFSIFLAKTTRVFKGKNKVNKLIDNLSYKAFSKPFKKEGDDLAWLSSDPKVWDQYRKDDLNPTSFTNESFIGMLSWLDFIARKSSYANFKSNNSLLICGDKDPVGKNSKGPKKVLKRLKKHGHQAKIIIYKNARHEIHNDKEKNSVYKDILDFII